MPSELELVQGFIQQVVEAIAAVVEVEVMIIDENLTLVAATGSIRYEIGSHFDAGSLTQQLMRSGQYYFADDPKTYPPCGGCEKRPSCQHLAVLVYPIKFGNKIIGTLCLTAISEDQKRRLLCYQPRLVNFADKMAQLIANTVKERQVRDELTCLMNRFNAVVDAVHEGIIATDSQGVVLHSNRSAEELLEIPKGELVGRRLDNLFADLSVATALRSDTPTEQELSCQMGGRRRSQFWATIVSLRDGAVGQGLVISFRNIVEMQRYATRLLSDPGRCTLDDIIGQSPAFLEVKEKVRRVASTDSTVLIRGESGTGKELFARAIHEHSHRRRGPFIAINCSAIPESLLESELFGYEEGAFTGARKGGKPGKFELADGGTLFLDEIGDMPLHLQAKILRVLENKSVERVGGTKPRLVDVRIVAATHRDLEAMMEHHEFRQDLYYRLSVIPVNISPLRERKEDIPLLVNYLINKYNKKFNLNIRGVTEEVMERLMAYSWPGNVRELENVIEYGMNMERSDYITVQSLPARLAKIEPAGSTSQAAKLRELEREAIEEALRLFGNTVAGKERAARYLGISRATLYRRLKKMGL